MNGQGYFGNCWECERIIEKPAAGGALCSRLFVRYDVLLQNSYSVRFCRRQHFEQGS